MLHSTHNKHFQKSHWANTIEIYRRRINHFSYSCQGFDPAWFSRLRTPRAARNRLPLPVSYSSLSSLFFSCKLCSNLSVECIHTGLNVQLATFLHYSLVFSFLTIEVKTKVWLISRNPSNYFQVGLRKFLSFS